VNYKKIRDDIIERARCRSYDSKYYHNHRIVPRHVGANSAEMVLLTIKEHSTVHHLNWKLYGRWQDKAAWRMLRWGSQDPEAARLMQVESGKRGGRTTKDNQKGLFSPEWDRAGQSKRNWESGLLDHQHLRSSWTKIGQRALTQSGWRSGFVNPEWRPENKHLIPAYCATAGKVGGKITGSKLWCNNGLTNTRSHTCPGVGWVRGMLMSDKKRNQVYSNLAGHNRKST
jgi:hypothetical protein